MKLVTDIQISGFVPLEEEKRIIVEFSDGSAQDIKFTGPTYADRVAAAFRTLAMAIGRDS